MAPLRPSTSIHNNTSNNAIAGPPPEFRRHLFKTKLCRFAGMGKCRHGGDCPFAHSPAELEEQPDLTKTSICRDWLKGCCNASNLDCPFAHGEEELREAPFKKPGFVHTPFDSKALAICLQSELSAADLREAHKPGRIHRNRKQLGITGGQRRFSAPGDHDDTYSPYQAATGDMGKPPGALYPIGNKQRRSTMGTALDPYSAAFVPDAFEPFQSYTASRRASRENGSTHLPLGPCVADGECQGLMLPLPMSDAATMSPVGGSEATWLSTSSVPWTPTNVATGDLEAMLRMAMPDHYED